MKEYRPNNEIYNRVIDMLFSFATRFLLLQRHGIKNNNLTSPTHVQQDNRK